MRRMMHLRVVAGTGGGPEKTILNSPRFIRQHGYEAEVVYLAPPGGEIANSLKSRAAGLDCPLTVLDDRGPFDFGLLRKLSRMIREHGIELLQAHDYKSNVIGLLLRQRHSIRTATMLHGWTDMSGRMPLYKKIDRWCLPWYEALICVSEDLAAECRELRIPEDRIHLVHNAIDTVQFARERSISEAKSKLGAREGRLLVGTVGRLSPEKGILPLLDVVRKLQDEGIACDFWIAGDGPQRQEIEDRVAALGLGDSVRLLGQLRDTRVFYQAMDLFVLNSIREGLPNVILEAMALEVPVIATRIAGIPSLIRPGETGILIEPDRSDQLYESMLGCLGGAIDTQQLVRGARQLIEQEYSFDRRMEKIGSIYDAMFDARGGVRRGDRDRMASPLRG